VGPFLTEDLYADWSFMRREQLAQDHVAMCSALASHAFDAADYAAAVHWATAMLEHDRCNEAAYRQQMRAYAAEGRRGEALRQYQQCEQVLQSELGVAPMAETTVSSTTWCVAKMARRVLAAEIVCCSLERLGCAGHQRWCLRVGRITRDLEGEPEVTRWKDHAHELHDPA